MHCSFGSPVARRYDASGPIDNRGFDPINRIGPSTGQLFRQAHIDFIESKLARSSGC